jgi:zinc transport system substrate-binding protein
MALLAGCSNRDTSRRPVVAVSVAPQATFVERIAGDLVQVVVMIPPGANPSTYAPTVHQVQAVSGASLYFKVGHPGFPFERAWLDSMLSVESEIDVVDGSTDAPCSADDPHLWVSPRVVRQMASNLTSALERALPEHRDTLRDNLRAFEDEIDELDRLLHGSLDGFRGRPFLVFHPSWGCFAEEYGLRQIAIEHEGKEPSAHEVADLIRAARDQGIRTVFVQPQVSTRAAETVAEAIDGRIVTLDPLARDWLDNLIHVAEALRDSFLASDRRPDGATADE